MKPRGDREFARLPEDVMLAIDRLCNRLEAGWRCGTAIRLETLLRELDPKHRFAGLAELLPLEVEYRSRAGQPLTLDELTKRFPTVQKNWLNKQLATATEGTAFIEISEEAPSQLPEVLGDYRILSRLGGGGMGFVYRAVHERMGREVALKVLKPEIQNNIALLQRFDREVRAAAKLSHPNIVTALDARTHDGVHFLVTELVEGSDLDHHVRQHGPLSAAQAVDVLLQAATGLAYAHAQGVIHRDIKPANLLLSREGVVKILDMGLARLESDDYDQKGGELTDTGVVMGTAAYMPPEQARDTRRADTRSDIYSLGCTLHFLVTGRPVYTGVSQVDTILSHVNLPVPSLRSVVPGVSSALDHLFQSMIAKEPADRIQTAAEVTERLNALRNDGFENSESAELRDLIARMSTAVPGQSVTAAPTQLHFENSGGINVVAKKSMPRSRGLYVPAIVCSILTVGVGLWWGLSRSGQSSDQIRGAAKPKSKDVVVAAEELSNSVGNRNNASTDAGSSTKNVSRIISPADRPVAASIDSVPSLNFNGISNYIMTSGIVPEPGGTYTFEVVARASRYQTSNLVSWLGPNWMAIYISEEGLLGTARQLPSSPDVRSSGHILSTSEWTHIAVTFAGDQMQLFINGQPVEQQIVNFELANTEGGLYLGGVDPQRLQVGQNQRFFAGEIRGFRLSRGRTYDAEFQPTSRFEITQDTITLLQRDPSGVPRFVDQTGNELPIEINP